MSELFNKDMVNYGTNRSSIRELFEFGKKRAQEVGADKVYDYSLGNPNVPAPESVRETLKKLVAIPDSTLIHGYTSAPGDIRVRKAIADSINNRFGVNMTPDYIYMTCGAAASLCITLKALNTENSEIIILAPFFPEYKVFTLSSGNIPKIVNYVESTFAPNMEELEKTINANTKAIIINSPNNPCGTVYSEETIISITSLLKKKEEEYGHPIFIIADEPYREIVFGDIKVPYIMNYYDNTIVCYSYSKSLSLPGERIGYIAVSPKATDADLLYAGVCGAGRCLGYVCAPSIWQNVIIDCVNDLPNIKAYEDNRNLLYNSLTDIGYTCVRPDGAFYLFIKTLEADAKAFSNRAKEYGLLLVPGDDFGAKGYVRAAYCVSNDMIRRSIPAFKELYLSYNK